MKSLFLVRHAKSSWKDSDLSDFERPLNGRGRNDAPKMGRFLRERKIIPDIILSSPANRAATTARIIADILNYPCSNIQYADQIYEANVKELYDIVAKIADQYACAMLVGHNPGMTFFANSVSNYSITNIPTCGIFAMELNITAWKDISENSGTFVFFEYPKKK